MTRTMTAQTTAINKTMTKTTTMKTTTTKRTTMKKTKKICLSSSFKLVWVLLSAHIEKLSGLLCEGISDGICED